MAKQVSKKITKKVVGAVADAGINLACEEIVDQMSQAVDCISECIVNVNSFGDMSQDKDLQDKMSDFLRREHPEKAERYLHEIFNRVCHRKSFLEIWDQIKSKVYSVANVGTQAHANATKHLQMCNKKLKGKGVMRSIGYVSRFAPFITESVKIGLIKEKMKQLKEELKQELDEHHIAEHTEQSLGEISW